VAVTALLPWIACGLVDRPFREGATGRHRFRIDGGHLVAKPRYAQAGADGGIALTWIDAMRES